MSILNVNKIQPVGSASTITVSGVVDFQSTPKVGGDIQSLDTYGIIKTNRATLNESVIIPTGTNGMTAGPLTVGAGVSVTINGAWTIV
jgi:hypothetical protein